MTDVNPNPVIADALSYCEDKNRLSRGMAAMATRRDMFGSELEMRLAGAAMVPEARSLVNARMTQYWDSRPRFRIDQAKYSLARREIVIGAGYAAAVYAAARVRAGFPKPIVLEQGSAEQIGGAFAMSQEPVFWLNSGNRAGKPGLPGDLSSALNYIPGGLIQPSMMSAGEYSTNADMAWAIRLALLQYAEVYPNTTVESLGDSTVSYLMFSSTEGSWPAGRILDARGLGEELSADQANGSTVLTFSQFMRRMGSETFPLQGLKKVAVVGGGDSGKCTVESLLGIAPAMGMSVAAMDSVQRIDWYSTRLPSTCDEWRKTQRGRYQQIGKYLPRLGATGQRPLKVLQELAAPQPSLDGVYLNGDTYDLAVLATGYQRKGFEGISYSTAPLGLCRKSAIGEVYRIGTCSNLDFTAREQVNGVSSISANKVAMFRYGPRIAALAGKLPQAGEEAKF